MKIIRTRYIPKGVKAISLFGFLLVRPKARVTTILLTHEEIHFCQQKETLFVFFFIIYAISWLINLPLCLLNKKRGQQRYTKRMDVWQRTYRSIIFEREAYANQGNANYILSRRFFAWVKS
jgi:hypothetical protein